MEAAEGSAWDEHATSSDNTPIPGWISDCEQRASRCHAVVLDPFAGSGTHLWQWPTASTASVSGVISPIRAWQRGA